jgi:NADPH:quinone reductase-like Zn-dependent oxidoreductase
MTMRAARLHAHGAGLRLELDELEIPEPQAGEALVRVRACGLNRIDLLARDGQAAPPQLPHTPGSEVAGDVVSVGPGVADWGPGDRVAVDPVISCGECSFCRRGQGNMCLRGRIYGVQTTGGYAEYTLAPASQLIRLPDALTYEAAASVTAAGATAWRMLVHRARVRVDEKVLVIAGASGLGAMAIQIAALAGARVAATAGSDAKCARAEELGAEVTVNHRDPEWPDAVRRWTGGPGVDIVVEHVGAATWAGSLRALTRGGRLVTCGGHSGFGVELDLWSFFVKGQTLLGSFAATRQDLVDVLHLVADGRIDPVIDSVLPLEQAAEAQRRLDAREAVGKVLLNPLRSAT